LSTITFPDVARSGNARHVALYFATVYKRTWRGSLITTFVNPIFFLTAMGLGLGSLVNKGSPPSALDGVSYLAFVAPALIATTAMRTGAVEASWPVLGNIKWTRSYYVMLTTPLEIGSIVTGQLLWTAVRLAQSAAAYFLVMSAFGATESAWGLLAVPGGVLTGLAFAGPLMAFAATLEREGSIVAVERFVLIPLFLFSGTFFPVTTLPAGLRAVAYVSPLWHGVDLCRRLTLGTLGWGPIIGHCLYLAAFAVVGAVLARRLLHRRLTT
jgi:lipooligosaccharide transport system permease protein